MKVKISFEIDYDDPHYPLEHDRLMDAIRNYYENEMCIPITDNTAWKTLSQINITDDYKSPENKEE